MTIKAVIFDIYKTVLQVNPPPPNAEQSWRELGEATWGQPPALSLAEFDLAAQRIIAREHAAARELGVVHPEVFWPAVAVEALPQLAGLSPAELDLLLYRHAQLVRTIDLMPGAGAALAEFGYGDLLFGIASNAQPYTLHELAAALRSAQLGADIFHPKLCFWSFESGFSKPNPHVFRWLNARLLERGVAPQETLMVGDRWDNDIAPAQAQDWQTWQIEAPSGGPNRGGSWPELTEFLRRHTRTDAEPPGSQLLTHRTDSESVQVHSPAADDGGGSTAGNHER